jgi:hypothetical protein
LLVFFNKSALRGGGRYQPGGFALWVPWNAVEN